MMAAADGGGDGGAPPGTSGVLCRWAAHEAGATRAVAAAVGGCVTGSSTGPIMAWKFRRGDAAEARDAPVLVSKLLGHVAAVVGLSTGNPAHLVSGAHDGTVRVWDMPRLSDAPGARGAEPGTDLAGVIDDIPLGPESEAGARGSGSGDDAYDAYDAYDASGSGSGPGGLSSSAEEADAAPPPAPERREALYAVTGHTVWLGDVCADDERIVCDGANNVTICYDFTEDPDGDGEI